MKTTSTTIFNFDGQIDVYHGKVRDVYTLSENRLVMVASDRISAFDHILPKEFHIKAKCLIRLRLIF